MRPMCGLKLGDMVGRVVVQSPAEFADWMGSAELIDNGHSPLGTEEQTP